MPGPYPNEPWYLTAVRSWDPPRWLWRGFAAVTFLGITLRRVLSLDVHKRNFAEQLNAVGPRSLGVALLTSAFVGMVFTIQFVREFAKLGLTRSVGGVLALALGRELTPVVTAIILAGRVGSAFAAELGTMQVRGAAAERERERERERESEREKDGFTTYIYDLSSF